MAKNLCVDGNKCIGCTLCTQICPSVFEMDSDGKSAVISGINVSDIDDKETVSQIDTAISACPVSCIKWKE